MKLNWFVSAEVPAGVNPGELTRELAAYVERLASFHGRDSTTAAETHLLGPDQVIVDADALHRLQARAGLRR